jgi:hypothetical protein
MTERSYYRIFFIIGLIALVAVFASFIGVYLLFWAFSTYGVWLYAFIAIGISALAVIWYIYDLHKKRQVKAHAE